jgi:hypothetical protein
MKITVWGTLLNNDFAVEFPYDEVGQSYVEYNNAVNVSEDLRNRIVIVISQEDLEIIQRKRENEKPPLVITNISLDVNEITFPVVLLDNARNDFWNFVYNHYNQTQQIAIYREYREIGEIENDLTFSSSRGPAMSGLLKPEVVAPSAGIVSAQSLPNGFPNHDITTFNGMIIDGTSISCANVAGSAALITEYLQKYHNLNPSSSLIKAVIIGSADLPYDENPEPNVEYGFGIVNLGAHLPFNESTFNLLVADHVLINDQTHLIAPINVISSDNELRVTISFIDVITTFDGLIPLFGELLLLLESPSHDFYRGNQHPNKEEEHFSTHQRVIIFPNVELGIWTIHIIANLVPDLIDQLEFSIVVRGSIDDTKLNFTITTSCIECLGICDTSSGLCKCENNKIGQSCQFELEQISFSSIAKINIPSSGNAYLSFMAPSTSAGELTVTITITDLYSLTYYPIIHLFISVEMGEASGFPRDYDFSDWGVYSYVYQFSQEGENEELGRIMIHNAVWWEVSYQVETNWIERPTRSPTGVEFSTGVIVGLSIGIVGIVVLVVVVIVVKCSRRARKKLEEDTKTDGMTEQLTAGEVQKGYV